MPDKVNLLLKIPVRDEELEVGIRSSQGGFSLVQLENLEADPLPEIKPEPPLAAGQQPNELISSTAMELVLREETAHDPDPWLLVDLRPVVAPPMELSLRVAASGEDDEGEGAAPAVAVNAFGQRPAANPFNVITACKPLDEWLLQTMTSDDMMAPTVTVRARELIETRKRADLHCLTIVTAGPVHRLGSYVPMACAIRSSTCRAAALEVLARRA